MPRWPVKEDFAPEAETVAVTTEPPAKKPTTIREMSANGLTNVYVLESGRLKQVLTGKYNSSGLISKNVHRPVSINGINLYGQCLLPEVILPDVNAILSAADREDADRMVEHVPVYEQVPL